MRMRLSVLLVLSISFLFSFAQENQIDKPFDFDKIKPTLKIENIPESNKIKQWIEKKITANPSSSFFTKSCNDFLESIPDDIELGNEEVPGILEKEFKKRWANQFDMKRIPPVHPFELGNGGCTKVHIINCKFIGIDSNQFYFTISVYCDNDKKNSNKLILSIINDRGKYFISNVMNQIKGNYFKDNI